MTDNSFVLPKTQEGIWRAGIVGNVIVSAVAALVSWGISGQVATIVLFQIVKTQETQPPAAALPIVLLTVGSLMNALLVGIAGARWLTNQIDKKLLQKAASDAKATQPNEDVAREMLNATPAHALSLATQ
jgi:hypothetical protein